MLYSSPTLPTDEIFKPGALLWDKAILVGHTLVLPVSFQPARAEPLSCRNHHVSGLCREANTCPFYCWVNLRESKRNYRDVETL